MSEIIKYDFTKKGIEEIKKTKYGYNWPVVYIINNNKEAYVGETSSLCYRMKTHMRVEERKKMKDIYIIYDEKFNKSVVLDIESFLIQHMSGDNKYLLQNRNSGQNRAHNYYQRDKYLKSMDEIWDELRKRDLITNDLKVIKDTDLFKFSPYKALTADQNEAAQDILFDITANVDKKRTYLVTGNAGTGKSVLAVYLMKIISDYANNDYTMEELEEDEEPYVNLSLLRNYGAFEIGLVIPTASLRHTLKKVFKKVKGLKASMVIGPSDVRKKEYDLLIVDEAHRLRRRKSLANYDIFNTVNKEMQLPDDGTELDWILKKSKKQILFYDKKQTVRSADIPDELFMNKMISQNFQEFHLGTQMRVQGGDEYLNFIDRIFDGKKSRFKAKAKNNEYDFQIFDNIDDMVTEIKNKNDVWRLSRVAAGYAWPWKTKRLKLDEIERDGLFDIEIQGNRYIWNHKMEDWIGTSNSINEIGCYHTIAGYDLNYIGVIIGNDLIYDKEQKRIMAVPGNYYDSKGKEGETDESITHKIINAYKILLKRGIRGTYVYVCDDNLREYLKKCIS